MSVFSNEPMIVWDARMIEHTGIGTYLRGLLPNLVSMGKARGLRFTLLGPSDKLAKWLKLGNEVIYHDYRARIYSLRHHLFCPVLDGALAYHFPHYDVPLRFSRPFFVTIHDIIPLMAQVYQHRLAYKTVVQILASRASRRGIKVFVPTHHVADSLTKYLSVPPKKIEVTPYAPLPAFSEGNHIDVSSTLSRLKVRQPYFLCVSLHKPHKNLELLLRAFRETRRHTGCDYYLVLAGAGSRNKKKLARLISELLAPHQQRLVHIIEEHLSDLEMAALYREAEAVIHPSMVEGFGLPIVEAQAVAVPVVVPDLPWARETAGDAALFFRPSQLDSLVHALNLVVKDSALRRHLAAMSARNIQRFSWSRTASVVLDVYNNCL